MLLQLATKPTIFLSSSLTRFPTIPIFHTHFRILKAEEYWFSTCAFIITQRGSSARHLPFVLPLTPELS